MYILCKKLNPETPCGISWNIRQIKTPTHFQTSKN